MKLNVISTPRRSTRTNFGVFGTRYVPEGHLDHAFFRNWLKTVTPMALTPIWPTWLLLQQIQQ